MMSRLARIAAVNIPYHVTQRGNARQFILTNDDERTADWTLLGKHVHLDELSLFGDCLMSNHVPLLLKSGKRSVCPRLCRPDGCEL